MAGMAFAGTVRRGSNGSSEESLHRLTRRADYLAAKSGRRAHFPMFSLQARPRGDDHPPRIGITVTRQVGGAVVRNRVKRRLKHAICHTQGLGFQAGYDYVVLARTLAASVRFDALAGALRSALEKVHGKRVPASAAALPQNDRPSQP